MNIKLIFILVVSLIVVGGLVGLGMKLVGLQGGGAQPNDEYVFPDGEEVVIPDGKMVVPTLGSGAATVNDIRAGAGVEDIGDQNFVISDSSSVPRYSIVFYEEDRSYLISLKSMPLSVARREGEAELLRRLGITKEVACTLRVRVGVPFEVSETYSARELGMSFCGGSVTLE